MRNVSNVLLFFLKEVFLYIHELNIKTKIYSRLVEHKEVKEMRKKLFTSESVTEGHPDKMCDQISDAVLDAALSQDPESRVACETTVTTGFCQVMGEITTKGFVDFQEVIRGVVKDIGYTKSEYGFDSFSCGIIVAIHQQSDDIALGVDKALEYKEGSLKDEDKIATTGAGDQG